MVVGYEPCKKGRLMPLFPPRKVQEPSWWADWVIVGRIKGVELTAAGAYIGRKAYHF